MIRLWLRKGLPLVVFFLGVAFVAVELCVLPGTVIVGVTGLSMVFVSVVMARVDLYPAPGRWLPNLPGPDAFSEPMETLGMALLGTLVLLVVFSGAQAIVERLA